MRTRLVWPVLLFLILFGSIAAAQAVAPPATPLEPEEIDVSGDIYSGLLFLIFVGFIFASYLWLLRARDARQPIFQEPPPPPAQWGALDILVVFIAFVALPMPLLLLPGARSNEMGIMAASMLAVSILVLWLIHRRGQDYGDVFGFNRGNTLRATARGLAVFFALLPVLFVFIVGWGDFVHWLDPGANQTQEVVQKFIQAKSIYTTIQFAIAAALVAPVTEEILFRGFLFGAFRRWISPGLAMIFAGLIFGLLHPPLSSMIPMSVLGMTLCWLYEKTGRLGVAMAAHASFNLYTTLSILFDKFT